MKVLKKKSLKITFLINLCVTILIGILSFVVNKFFGKYMGAEHLGLMKLFTQLVAYLSLADMGIGAASTFALYKPLAEKNYNKINIIMSTLNVLYNKIAIFIFFAGIILVPFIPKLINEDIGMSSQYNIYIYWILYVISTCLTYLYAKYVVLFTADQGLNYVKLIQGFSKILSQILQIYILIKFQSFMGFIILLSLDGFLQYSCYLYFFSKKYKYVKKVKERDKEIGKNLVNLFWHKVTGLIVFNTDYIIISKFLSLSIVGVYSSYLLVVNLITGFLSILTAVINPKIGEYIATHTKEEIFDLWKKINLLYMIIGGILTYITYYLINDFIFLWMGPEYILKNTTVILIMINLFVQLTRGATEIFKMNSGYFNDIQLPFFEGLINLVLSIVLVRNIGLDGVILGTVSSNLIIICIARPLLVFKNCFNQKKSRYLKILLKQIILIGLGMTTLNYILLRNVNFKIIRDWQSFIEKGLIISIGTAVIFCGFFVLDLEFRQILRKLFVKNKLIVKKI